MSFDSTISLLVGLIDNFTSFNVISHKATRKACDSPSYSRGPGSKPQYLKPQAKAFNRYMYST